MSYYLDITQYIQIYGLITHKYWNLQSEICDDNESQCTNNIYSLIKNSTKLQIQDSEKIGIIYPESINSCILSGVSKKLIDDVYTYSYDINDEKSKSLDYVKMLKKKMNIDDYKIISDNKVLHSLLIPAMMARDMPGMSFLDSTYLEFFSSIKDNGTDKCLSSLCSDYLFNTPALPFPLCLSKDIRSGIINKELANEQVLNEYIEAKYNEVIEEIVFLDNEDNKDIRINKYLNIKLYIQSIAQRLNCIASSIDLEVELPYLDYRIVQYIYNIQDGDYLTKIFGKLFPNVNIKKSKTSTTNDLNNIGILEHEVKKILNDSSSKLLKIVDKKYVQQILSSKGSNLIINKNDELISYTQILAYLIQIEYWLNIYEVEIDF